MNQQLIKKIFEYNEADGGLYYKIKTAPKVKVGKRFGFVDEKGYRRGIVNGINVREHTLVWMYHNDIMPKDLEIDHINRIKTDNRINNLRAVTHSVNLKNRNPYKIHK